MSAIDIKRKLIDRLADSPTALLCNAYDFMGMHAPATDSSILSLTPEFPPMVGQAITISLDCSTPEGGQYLTQNAEDDPKGVDLYYKMIEIMSQSDLPQIVVIQSLGNLKYGAVLGDGMAKTILSAGGIGAITNGTVRDLKDVKRAGLNTFASGVTVNHHPLHWSGLMKPVNIGGLEVKTGDIIHADSDGVITLPEAGWGKIVRACRYVLDFEKVAHVNLRRSELTVAERAAKVREAAAMYKRLIDDIEGEDEL